MSLSVVWNPLGLGYMCVTDAHLTTQVIWSFEAKDEALAGEYRYCDAFRPLCDRGSRSFRRSVTRSNRCYGEHLFSAVWQWHLNNPPRYNHPYSTLNPYNFSTFQQTKTLQETFSRISFIKNSNPKSTILRSPQKSSLEFSNLQMLPFNYALTERPKTLKSLIPPV